MPVPTLWSKSQFVSSQTLLSSGSLGIPRVSCPAGVNNTRSCSDILLNPATVDCLAASDTSLIDHYHRCLLAVCGVDTSALDPTLAYIEHNCGEDGKFEALVVVSYLIFRLV